MTITTQLSTVASIHFLLLTYVRGRSIYYRLRRQIPTFDNSFIRFDVSFIDRVNHREKRSGARVLVGRDHTDDNESLTDSLRSEIDNKTIPIVHR